MNLDKCKTLKDYRETKLFTNDQLSIINDCLLQNIDASKIANPEYSPEQMNTLMNCLKDGIDITIFADAKNDPHQMLKISFDEIKNSKDIVERIFQRGFNAIEACEILVGVQKNLNVWIYAQKHFNNMQMKQIRLGLQMDMNVFEYAKPHFSHEKMKQIREKMLLDPKYSIKKIKN